MVAHHLEVERKYELADLGGQAPVIAWQFESWIADTPVVEELYATYFDTPQGQLAAHSLALRRRLGGYDEGWHIKFDVSGDRHEVSFSLAENPEDMPEDIRRFVRVLTAGSALEPRVGLATHRSRTVIRSSDGQALAEICDDRVQALDYATGVERAWQEWEIELLEPAQSDANLAHKVFSTVEELLLAAGAGPSSSPAKITRALGKDAEFERRREAHLKQSEGLPEQGVELSPVASADAVWRDPATSADMLAEIVNRYSIELGQADLLVRAGLPDSSHQGRVIARQLRSVLAFMAVPYAKDEQAKAQLQTILGGLKTYASELEQHRNGELILPMAQLGLARTQLLGDKDLAELAHLEQEQTQEGLVSAMTYLNSSQRLNLQQSLRDLQKDLDRFVDLPAQREKYSAKVARRLQKKMVKQGLKAVKAWPDSAGDFAVTTAYDDGVHDLRKLAKATRYCLTACADAGISLSEGQETLLKSARLLQAELGKLTDELTFLDWLKGLNESSTAGLSPFTVGCLAGRSEHVAQKLRESIHSSVPPVLQKIRSIDL
ncbi:CHAD domain-containing protein [Rothia sp. P5764]|uniref:CYTH and CHAD domain-containing protein n=1 Tax=Rothia sp. P5764 TaxID=3402654 RepID=UPI003AC39591